MNNSYVNMYMIVPDEVITVIKHEHEHIEKHFIKLCEYIINRLSITIKYTLIDI